MGILLVCLMRVSGHCKPNELQVIEKANESPVSLFRDQPIFFSYKEVFPGIVTDFCPHLVNHSFIWW